MRQLVTLCDLQAAWMGHAPDGIAQSLADELLNMLSLELVYIHLIGPTGMVEVFRSKHRHGDAQLQAMRPALRTLLAGQDVPATIPDLFGTGTLRVAVTRFGIDDDSGVLISGSRDAEFPGDDDDVLLGVAANQAATALQRWRVEDRLRQSDARSSTILETALDCIITMDHNGNVVDFNPAAESTFGYRRADIVGQQLADLISPAPLRERHRRGMAHYLATGEGPIFGKRVEMPALRADGAEFPVELTITRIPGEGGPVFVAYLRDISERKQSEAVLRESEARFRGLIEEAPFSVQVFSPDGRMLQVNRCWEELWGVTLAEIGDYNILTDRQLEEKGVLRYIQRGFAGHATRIPAIEYNPDDTVPGVTRHADPRRCVVDDIRTAIDANIDMPAGYYVEYGGQFESAEAAATRLLLLGVIVIVGIFLLLVAAFGTARNAALVMLNLPLALIGGVAGVWFSGGVMTVAAVIGFITLFGIATRNGVILIDHITRLMRDNGLDAATAVRLGAEERLVPILMTALATALALVPLALAGGEPGSEIQAPMAVVILWGLVSSTALNMLVVPAMFLRFGAPIATGTSVR